MTWNNFPSLEGEKNFNLLLMVKCSRKHLQWTTWEKNLRNKLLHLKPYIICRKVSKKLNMIPVESIFFLKAKRRFWKKGASTCSCVEITWPQKHSTSHKKQFPAFVKGNLRKKWLERSPFFGVSSQHQRYT